jgi:hypothetical protein
VFHCLILDDDESSGGSEDEEYEKGEWSLCGSDTHAGLFLDIACGKVPRVQESNNKGGRRGCTAWWRWRTLAKWMSEVSCVVAVPAACRQSTTSYSASTRPLSSQRCIVRAASPQPAALRVAPPTAAALQLSLRGQHTSWYKAGAQPYAAACVGPMRHCTRCIRDTSHLL